MSTYAIGDLQGCFESFIRLLEKIHFDPKNDTVWLTGDLVNRGPQSLETLRFVKSLGDRATTVLGNHDLTLLAVAYQVFPFDAAHHTFSDILEAPDKIELIDWLIHRSLLHWDKNLNFLLVHAGFYPKWDLPLLLSLAKEVEAELQGSASSLFLKNMYGNEPSIWNNQLQGYDRLRFITNCFTRMRFCSSEGELELTLKESVAHAPNGYLPWFSIPNPAISSLKIVFGHWASLEGKCDVTNVFPLVTGCVWGNCLTAMRLVDQILFSIPCADRVSFP